MATAAVEALVRNLFAAGYASTEDGQGAYLLREVGGELVRERWVGTEQEGREVVANRVRPDSKAVYLVWDGPADSPSTARQV